MSCEQMDGQSSRYKQRQEVCQYPQYGVRPVACTGFLLPHDALPYVSVPHPVAACSACLTVWFIMLQHSVVASKFSHRFRFRTKIWNYLPYREQACTIFLRLSRLLSGRAVACVSGPPTRYRALSDDCAEALQKTGTPDSICIRRASGTCPPCFRQSGTEGMFHAVLPGDGEA